MKIGWKIVGWSPTKWLKSAQKSIETWDAEMLYTRVVCGWITHHNKWYFPQKHEHKKPISIDNNYDLVKTRSFHFCPIVVQCNVKVQLISSFTWKLVSILCDKRNSMTLKVETPEFR